VWIVETYQAATLAIALPNYTISQKFQIVQHRKIMSKNVVVRRQNNENPKIICNEKID
jgi:hypothetical protein